MPITSSLVIRRFTCGATRSRVYSSMIDRIFNGRPLTVLSYSATAGQALFLPHRSAAALYFQRPHLIHSLCFSTDNSTTRIAQSPAFSLLLRHFQPLLPPKPVNSLEVHTPAFVSQQPSDLAISIPRKFTNQFQDASEQQQLITLHFGLISLRRESE